MGPHHVEFTESERQLALLALAALSVENPGFDYALNELALKLDNQVEGRAEMYDGFRALRSKVREAKKGSTG